jgi:AAA+ superfamily predicted ATPase
MQTSVPSGSAPVLELILTRVRLRAQRRATWLTHLGNNPDAGTTIPLDPNLAACLDGRDTPEAEADWYARADAVQPLNSAIAQVEQALAGEAGARLHELQALFRLGDPEMDLLHACLAPAIDPAIGVAYAYLQQHPGRCYPTDSLAARLLGHGRRALWHAGGALAAWGLVAPGAVAPGEPAPLAVDPLVAGWLQGTPRLDAVLVGPVQMVVPREPLACWPVAAAVRFVEYAVERDAPVRILVAGPPASGRRTFAAAVATRFGVETLAVDTTEIADSDWPDAFMRAQRLAVMGGMALLWHGNRLDRPWPRQVAPAPIQFVACAPDQVVHPWVDVVDHRMDLPAPTIEERRRLWAATLPASAAWPAAEVETLVTRYQMNTGDIVAVARRGPSTAGEAATFARELTRQRLGALGEYLDCPFTWDDLVVPARLREALVDFAFEARDREAFWEQPDARRLFPRGRGLVAIFSGPPGTGKTMAAQIVAAELALDLFRIDLAAVVSKYIGETAKHLAQIFARAAQMNGVLLFDEADALFSRRTEVKDSHDRYANVDTSYLLQLLEEYRGIVILATNRQQDVDHAFMRRVRYTFEFPRPDTAERQRIWQQLLGELSGHATVQRLEQNISTLAANVELSGAQIKHAVLDAIFVARRRREPLAMPHILSGIERELAKAGPATDTGERERFMPRWMSAQNAQAAWGE